MDHSAIRPSTTVRQQIKYGRLAAVVVMLLAIAWSAQGDKFSIIFEAINKIAAAIAPPVATIFHGEHPATPGLPENSINQITITFFMKNFNFHQSTETVFGTGRVAEAEEIVSKYGTS